MSLSSTHLDAFIAVAKTSNFSKAAKLLNLTQSGLSQKIKAFEGELGLSLFIRTPTGVLLTEQAEKLLRYSQVRDSMEAELLQSLSISNDSNLSGVLRVASYSSVFRSVIIPAITPFLKENPLVKVEFICEQMDDLPQKLQSAETDFIIMDYKLDKANLETCVLGQEKYVAISSKRCNDLMDTFLDNNSNDTATANFFKHQKIKPKKYFRSYFDDCYGIIDGVSNGFGSAIMSEHLVKKNKSLKIHSEYKPMLIDVNLHYYKQPFYSKLHQAFLDCLIKNSPKYLN